VRQRAKRVVHSRSGERTQTIFDPMSILLATFHDDARVTSRIVD
jgi:hypothetical protein